jgi:glc operon protein GlcG
VTATGKVRVDFATAKLFLETAKAIGASKGVEVSVAILDAAGHPVLLARGKPDAWHGPYMAAGKARLAAAFRKPTVKLIEQWADRPLYPMSLTSVIPGGVTLNPGGYPIFAEDGACIGALGIGGGSPALDDEVARLTIEALCAEKW